MPTNAISQRHHILTALFFTATATGTYTVRAADAICGFISISITLQESGAAPDKSLRPAALAVAQTAEVLVQIARQQAKGDEEEN